MLCHLKYTPSPFHVGGGAFLPKRKGGIGGRKVNWLAFCIYFYLRSPQLSVSAAVSSEDLHELGKCFFGRKYSFRLNQSLNSHGFAPIPVTSSILIELDEIMANFGVVVMDQTSVKV